MMYRYYQEIAAYRPAECHQESTHQRVIMRELLEMTRVKGI